MNEFLDRAFHACDPATVLTVLVVGLGLGAIFLRSISQRAGLTAWAMAVVGTAFFAFACVSRALQGVVNWPGWIGVWALWLVFTAGAYLAIKVRRSA